MKQSVRSLMIFMIASLLTIVSTACPPDDDDDNDNDDATPSDDDSGDDDSSPDDDDDATPDDDTVDDDTTDDDSSDDDTTDDDTADDDTTDDDTADDDSVDDDTGDTADLTILGGGETGRFGFRIRNAPDGTPYVGAVRGGYIKVFGLLDGVEVPGIPMIQTYYMAMDIDDQGHFHFLHTNWLTETLFYTTNVSGQWKTTYIAGGIEQSLKSEVVADADGAAHIVFMKYIDNSGYYVYYATNKTGSFVVTQIDESWEHNDEAGPDLVVDGDGKAYLSYEYGANVRVAHNKFGYWAKKSLDGCPDGGRSSTVTLDNEGQVNVFYPTNSYELIHGYADATMNWTCENLGGGGAYPDVVVDDDNHFHLTSVLSVSDAYLIVYTTDVSGAWTSEQLSSPNLTYNYRLNSDIALDADGNVHYVYFDSGQYNLMRSDLTPGGWVLNRPITGGGYKRNATTLALNPAGEPTIAFDTDSFYLATRAGDQWQIADLAIDAYYYDLAIDSAGHHHLFYNGGNDYIMNYLTDTGGSWQNTVVDYRGCEEVDMELDENEKVHAAYYCYSTPGEFGYYGVYVTNKSGAWTMDDPQVSADYPDGLQLRIIDGAAHLYFANDEGIFVSRQTGDGWTVEQLSTTDANLEDVLIDEQQNVHLLLSSYSNGMLHVDNTGGAWAAETIDAAADGDGALAFDNGGKLHAVYWGVGLRHAVLTPTGWEKEQLLLNNMEWEDCRLRIDDDNMAHVSLQGNEAQWYMSFLID